MKTKEKPHGRSHGARGYQFKASTMKTTERANVAQAESDFAAEMTRSAGPREARPSWCRQYAGAR
jgi:hypothetical protein